MPSADRLRHDIDQGRAGDKVPFPDPAAAPLGTDDEAAGSPPTPAEVEEAYATEFSGDASEAPGASDERARDYSGELTPERKRRHRWRAIYMLLGSGLALTLALWMLHG